MKEMVEGIRYVEAMGSGEVVAPGGIRKETSGADVLSQNVGSKSVTV